MCVCVRGPKVQVCAFENAFAFFGSEAQRHISSEITMRPHAAYLDDKQYGRDLSATKQIRQKYGGAAKEWK